MMEKIKNILSEMSQLDGWKIIENTVQAKELFFVKKNLDMNRGKDVHHFRVVIYKDFEEDGIKYRGSSSAKLHPTMNHDEIKRAISDAAFAAQFVKNKYYPLVKPVELEQPAISSKFAQQDLSKWLPQLTEAIFKEDQYDKGWINSSELFLNKVHTRITNSNGVDVSFKTYYGEIEIITNWTEASEEIELFKVLNFADFEPNFISKEIKSMLMMSREKAMATQTPTLTNYTVLLTGEPTKDLLKYYYEQANAQFVFEGISTAKVGENYQGEAITGDTITMNLDPFMSNSTGSAPYDDAGFPLNPVKIFEKGKLLNYWGDTRYSHYLDMEPTGNIQNVVVDHGSKSEETMKEEPYLEIAAFSDFRVDPLNGNFGGEIRLAWYFNGKERIPVTGGSLSGNILELHHNLFLSKELQKSNDFIGPKVIQLFGMDVSGS